MSIYTRIKECIHRWSKPDDDHYLDTYSLPLEAIEEIERIDRIDQQMKWSLGEYTLLTSGSLNVERPLPRRRHLASVPLGKD